MRRGIGALVVVGWCLIGSGCNKKVAECNALISQLNATSGAIQAPTADLAGASKDTKDKISQLANVTKEETAKIAAVNLTVDELKGFSKEYQGLLDEIVGAASELSKAASGLEEVQAAVSKDSKAWLAASGQLPVACIRARKDCKALGDKLVRPPMILGLHPAEDAKKLDEYGQGLADAKIENAEVAAAVEAIKSSVKSFSSSLRSADATTKALEKASEAMKATGEKEPKLVAGINDFCQGK